MSTLALRRTARLSLCAALLCGGCVGLSSTPQEALVASSLSLNQGRPHRALLDDSVPTVVDNVILLAKQRELTLVKQDSCTAQRCELVFRGKPVDRRIFRGTASLTLAYYSRYFVTVEQAQDKTGLSAVGLPVLGGEMSCPPAVQPTLRCRAPLLNRHADADLATSVRREWGYDITGALEAETLQGLIVELQRARGALRPARAHGGRMIVAVFDVEDPSHALSAATLGQLTEYLSAKVTQISGFQVVPRDQLRARLAQEKRQSYKACYDQRCQIELGKAVAAQRSLATKLLRVGKQCALTSLLYDLKTETTERAATVNTACAEEALLGGVEQLARQLAGRAP
jgi:hypothetical protein